MAFSFSPVLPRAALVTGAGRRIGRALAIDLAAQGFDVAVHRLASRREAAETAAQIQALGRKSVVVEADLADDSALGRLMDQAESALGPIGALVNNASLFEPDSAGALDSALWDKHMAINLKAPVFLADRFARALPPDAEGVIVNILDQRVWRLTPAFFSYTLSKAALWAATQTLAQALAPRIRVAAIGPGPTLASARQSGEDFLRQKDSAPLKRGPDLDELTAAIRFILAARSLTGQMIALDGGQHLAWETAGPE